MHLKLERLGERPLAHLDRAPRGAPYCPSVDVLFETAAAEFGAGVLGVVLAEAESSCVVDGMPRCIREAGLAAGVAPIDQMAAEIARFL